MNNHLQSQEVAIEVRGLSKKFLNSRQFAEIWQSSAIGARLSNPSYSTIFKNLSFSIPKGSTFGIFGVNGSGKTTLTYCLANLLAPDEGEILINGKSQKEYGSSYGQVVSKCSRRELYEEFSAVENVEFLTRLYKIDAQEGLKIARKFFNYLGVTKQDQETKPVGRLSLGNKGKIALVLSLIPLLRSISSSELAPILILDEPTFGFDVVSVEKFFSALELLKNAIPGLTVVIATNDPREAGYCDDYMAIVNAEGCRDDHQLELLRESMSHMRQAISAFSRLIGEDLKESNSASNLPELPRSVATSSSSATCAFTWRGLRDLAKHKLITLLVLLMLVLPNLIGLFASSTTFGMFRSVVMTTFGIFITVVVRESQRFLERERNYYCLIETVLLAPVSRIRHYLAVASFGWIQQSIYTLCTGLLLLLLLYPKLKIELWDTMEQLELSDCFGLGVWILAVSFAALAIGLLTSLCTFAVKPIYSWFLISMVPTFVVLCSGIYFPTEALPEFMIYALELNPFSYASSALVELLGIGDGEIFGLSKLTKDLFPNLSCAWIHLLTSLALSSLYFLLASLFFKSALGLLRRMGRLRNVAMA